jgi:hypothetical protein
MGKLQHDAIKSQPDPGGYDKRVDNLLVKFKMQRRKELKIK